MWEGEQIGKCLFTVVRICPSGYLLSGATCAQTLTQAAASSYTCPAGTTLSGASCQGSSTQVQTQAATPVYSCPAGLALNGNTCSDPTNVVADRKLTFTYGPEHQRVRQTVELTSTAPSHMEPGTTWYLNGTDSQGLTYEKTVQANGLIEHKHYVSVGSMTFALYVKREGSLNGKPATTVSYLHHDHLGSVAVITNETGAVSERLAYDPWGKRRNVDGQSDVLDALYGVHTDRGYTMHEHLDEVGIVHMNGRLYDPLIGRFMSADPFIQHPDDLQSFNRYAYVLNNPLAYTDPSGYFSLKKFIKAHHKFWRAPTAKNLFKFISAHPGQAQIDNFIMTNEWAYSIGQIAATAFTAACGGCGGAIWASYYTYQRTGSMSEAAKVGAIIMATYQAFGWAGKIGEIYGQYSFAHFGAHMLVGCASSIAGGGACDTGATSALFGKLTSFYLGEPAPNAGLEELILQGAAVSFAGGVGAELTGGNFWKGVETAAYGYLFNQLASRFQRNAALCGPEMCAGGGAGGGGRSARGGSDAPDFIVSPRGTAYPVPKGAEGPTPVVNPAGKTTGTAFTGGSGGANGQVDTMRIMNPTPARGSSPGYPNGYIKYENRGGQGVDPYSGRTLPNSQSHFSID